jgi:hypothetical protein
MDGGTNESSGMYVGMNSNCIASFAQNNGLIRINGGAGSLAANDLVIGNGSGNGSFNRAPDPVYGDEEPF